MKATIKRLTSAIAATSILTFSALGVKVENASIQPLQAVAQTVSCNTIRPVSTFFATAASSGVNIRSGPSLTASIVGRLAPNERRDFDAWTYGDIVNDLWLNRPDARWYRLKGTNYWVASGVVYGNPNPAPPTLCSNSGNFFRNPEAFFQWANGQRGIRRLDRNDLQGQCVTLIARYVQEVFMASNERTISRAYNHGYGTAGTLANNAPFNQYFGSYIRPSATSDLPRRGAVISFPGPDTRYGHVGIVMEVQRLSNGQRQVKILESNWDNKAENSTVRISGWINIPSSNSYGGTNGWTNPR
ncbi:CHAP domain-containing protein [Limnofasciculus baicalensis]|uniref:CHAP domain-containing protein n=1 Tax=Limnofasciculus baicalensis BBK-W-15 TaxID=2699891 RepID=A0AAE3GP52_9CYAN|nr:CHAP domain-containing protein [Limnofasciculus baicalensis]MCP2727248.1 CHAP domain-containing protein [Limnofasciculus baicalensis BBK-W-15]